MSQPGSGLPSSHNHAANKWLLFSRITNGAQEFFQMDMKRAIKEQKNDSKSDMWLNCAKQKSLSCSFRMVKFGIQAYNIGNQDFFFSNLVPSSNRWTQHGHYKQSDISLGRKKKDVLTTFCFKYYEFSRKSFFFYTNMISCFLYPKS